MQHQVEVLTLIEGERRRKVFYENLTLISAGNFSIGPRLREGHCEEVTVIRNLLEIVIRNCNKHTKSNFI